MANSKEKPKKELILLQELKCDVYWDILSVLKRHAFLNVSMGGRGIGKTWQAIIKALEDYKKYGDQFIYVRRYKSETTLQKHLLDDFCVGHTTKGIKNSAWEYSINGDTIGYCIPLSLQANFKSMSFTRVKTIIFDEAILMNGGVIRYIPNEVHVLFEFLSTVFRHRKDCRVFILGNNLNFFNPYCEYFNVKVFKNIYYDKERSLYIEYCSNSPALEEVEKTTPLYALTMGTTYHDYHYNNTVLTKNKFDVVKKKPNDKLIFRVVVNTYTLNFYLRDDKRFFIEANHKVIDDSYSIVLIRNSEVNTYNMMLFKSKWLEILRIKFYNGKCDFGDTNSPQLLDMILDLY